MKPEVDINSLRARKARLGQNIGAAFSMLLGVIAGALVFFGLYSEYSGEFAKLGSFAFSAAALFITIVLWYRYELKNLAPVPDAPTLDGVMDLALLATIPDQLSPQKAWQIALGRWEARFVSNRLLMTSDVVMPLLSTNPQDMRVVWEQADILRKASTSQQIHGGTLVAALLMTSEPAIQFLKTQDKLDREDIFEVISWLERHIAYLNSPKPNFGGIGRDWSVGFTPTLERYSQNMSNAVQTKGGFAHYYANSDLLDGIVNTLSRNGSVALVGPDGSGKTTLVYGLAQRLIQGKDANLAYYQVISLSASMILSASNYELESLMLTMFGEAIGSGNMIIFLDDAELFFSHGTGAFDMSQVLMPILKNHNIKLIAAFDVGAWQRLQAERQALTSSFTTVNLHEPDKATTLQVIEDAALFQEGKSGVLITFEALLEAHRLSGQYMQEQSYPGKAVNLIDQSMPYAIQRVLTAQSVQQAIESTKGVKVSTAGAPEVDMLLNMEDRIHERMINQKKAVNVIATALRRGRAGVANPSRPVGSFLFLGPTGVGKTELARSLAAVYFGDEKQMIRLDMSEVQGMGRILGTGDTHEQSLLQSIRQQPFSVVLFDEIEKADPQVLDLFLQMLDEGQLTDMQGRRASFRSSIIIATSNAGAIDINEHLKTGESLESFERPLIDKLIATGQFKPELINRFDEVVLFRPLNEEELSQVARIMLAGVNKTLAPQRITVQLTDTALAHIVHLGYDPEFGARPMRRMIQRTVENAIAMKILRGEAQPGTNILLDINDLHTAD